MESSARICPTISCLGSIAARISSKGKAPLGFLSIFDWLSVSVTPAVSIGFGKDNCVVIQILPGRPIAPQTALQLLSGVVPELLDCQILGFDGIEGVEFWRVEGFHEHLLFESLDSFVNFTVESSQGASSITITSPYGSDYLYPGYSDRTEVESALAWTRIGSPFRDKDYLLTWNVPNDSFQIAPPQRPNISAPELSFSAKLDISPDVRARLVVSPALSSKELVLSKNGRILQRSVMPKSVTRLLPLEAGYYCEVDWRSFKTAADGSLVIAGDVRDLKAKAYERLTAAFATVHFKDFYEQVRSKELEREADELERRKGILLRSRFVYFGDQLVFHEPTSENDVVVLLSKFEGLRALPMQRFQLLEYTPREGIDAIANIRVFPEEQDDLFEPIECEFSFDNFLLHGHPAEHVRYVLCWTIGSMRPRHLSRDDHHRWLWRFVMGKHHLRIFEMRQFPGVEIKENT